MQKLSFFKFSSKDTFFLLGSLTWNKPATLWSTGHCSKHLIHTGQGQKFMFSLLIFFTLLP